MTQSIRGSRLAALLGGAALVAAATVGVDRFTAARTDAPAAGPVVAAAPPTTGPTAPAPTGASSGGPSSASSSPAGSPTASSTSPAGGTTTTIAGSTARPRPASGTARATPRPSAAPPSSPPAAAPSSTPAQQFRDGTYRATAGYDSPGGPQQIGVTITVQHDVVTASALDLLGDTGVSHTYQSLFEKGYAAEVVGRPLSSVKVGAVGGSSLTGGGFNRAIQDIEGQARG